eukprot:GHVQ01039190.1.p2 GENE.GHVQ01039190.1~~GHVQ01039190.1.p2  ORF type:complete len:118 (-),score=31.34 GHVQ01039190.1:688-1041(-)
MVGRQGEREATTQTGGEGSNNTDRGGGSNTAVLLGDVIAADVIAAVFSGVSLKPYPPKTQTHTGAKTTARSPQQSKTHTSTQIQINSQTQPDTQTNNTRNSAHTAIPIRTTEMLRVL